MTVTASRAPGPRRDHRPCPSRARGTRSARLLGRCVLALVCLGAGAGAAAEDLLEVYRLALTRDPQFLASAAANRAAQELKPQARAALLPSLNAGASSAGNRLDVRATNSVAAGGGVRTFNTKQIEIDLRQPIFRKDLWVALDQADARIQQSNREFAFAEQDLMVRLGERYFGVLGAMDDLTFARANKEAIGQQLRQARERFEVGLIPITDVEEAQAGFDLATAEEIEAENALDNAREALREITGEYTVDLAGIGDEVPLVSPDPNDIDAWTVIALEQNLLLEASRHAAEASRDEIKRIEAGHLPTLDLFGRYSRSRSTGGFSGGSDSDTSTIGIELNVPIYQGGLVLSQTRGARHLYQQALEDLERQRRSTQRQAREAFLGVVSGISRVRALRQALISSESALEAVEAGFQVGTRTSIDVLTAQSNRFQAERDYAATRYEYILDILRLKLASGTLSEEDLATINAWLR